MATISTTARPAYVYDEGDDTWYPVGAQALAFVATYVYTATASQTSFSGVDDNALTLSYTVGAVEVFLNGALLTPGTDYSASNGTSIILATGAALNDILVAVASDTYEVANTYTQTETDALIAANGGAKGGGDDKIFFENGQTVTTSYTITTNKNAVTAGPVEISTGATVTIPTGSTWTVV